MKSEIQNGKSILRDKSYAFAIRIVKLSQHLQSNRKEFVLSRQILRSGSAIGALIREEEFGSSKADFANKMTIALKESNETQYWLSILKDTSYIDDNQFESMQTDCNCHACLNGENYKIK